MAHKINEEYNIMFNTDFEESRFYINPELVIGQKLYCILPNAKFNPEIFTVEVEEININISAIDYSYWREKWKKFLTLGLMKIKYDRKSEFLFSHSYKVYTHGIVGMEKRITKIEGKWFLGKDHELFFTKEDAIDSLRKKYCY